MSSTHSESGCPVARGFDVFADAYYRDPALHLAAVRDDTPVFWYERLHGWVVTRHEDVLRVLGDWQAFSSAANTAAQVPEEYREVFPPELVSHMIVGQDPPEHTETRRIAQRGFLKDRMDRLRPEIEARAHRIVDRFENNGSGNIVEDYCLELTTQTIMALLDLEHAREPMLRQLRDDLFAVLSSAHEDITEDARTRIWDRFVAANLELREIIESRRDSGADDLISVLASARDADGRRSLDTARIGLHIAEFAAAGTDTTAQAMANAILFLSRDADTLQDVLAEPDLWSRVFEETVRRRPSSTFTSRRATTDVEVGGVAIAAGEMIHLALSSANTDAAHRERPFEFDIHRPDPGDHLGFSTGRHTCLGNPLARVQGPTGLKVLFERLPSLRPDEPVELDFRPTALVPIRRSLQVGWDTADVQRHRERTVRTLDLDVVAHEQVADDVVALTLAHPDGGELPRWKPGAHIDVHLPVGGEALVRQYSLSSEPEHRTTYRIGVLREPDGRGGSAAVHDTLVPGSTVTVSWPRNNFRLASADRYLFVAGSIGITPILPMIAEADRAGAEWELVYGGRSRRSMAFLDEIAVRGGKITLVPQDEAGPVDVDGLLGTCRHDTLVYACGPESLLQAVERAMTGWPKDSLRMERFAPKPVVERTEPDSPFQVEFAGSGTVVDVGADETVLQAAANAGMPVLSSCAAGTCGTCETRILSGRADHRDSILSASEQEAGESMMICVSRAAGCSRLVLDQ